MTPEPAELDTSPLDLSQRVPDHDERFDQSALDESRWWPYYTPHWSSRAASAARYDIGDPGLTLRIDADTEPWSPEFDGEVRASHLQTGQFSGPVGSGIGQHRFRGGLIVREQQREKRLWLPHFGVIEVRMRAIRHPDAMVAFWPIGFEERPDDCGEICIAEIFGSDLDDTGGWVGVGVKPQRDPRLALDFEKVRVEGDLTDFHDYAVDLGSGPHPVLHRRPLGQDRAPNARLPGPVHARRVRAAERDGPAGCRRASVPLRGGARAQLPSGVALSTKSTAKSRSAHS